MTEVLREWGVRLPDGRVQEFRARLWAEEHIEFLRKSKRYAALVSREVTYGEWTQPTGSEHDPRCISLTDSEFNDHCDCATLRLIDTHEPPGSEQGGHPVTPETLTVGAETGPGAPNEPQTCNYPSSGPEPSGGRTANEDRQGPIASPFSERRLPGSLTRPTLIRREPYDHS